MKNEDVDEKKLEAGEYCRKGSATCFCAVGWPYERMCPECRDDRNPGWDDSCCVCPIPGTKKRDPSLRGKNVWRVEMADATFDLVEDMESYKIVEAAPIAKRFIGKYTNSVLSYYKQRGAKIIKLGW